MEYIYILIFLILISTIISCVNLYLIIKILRIKSKPKTKINPPITKVKKIYNELQKKITTDK